jgi:hypothetical protein
MTAGKIHQFDPAWDKARVKRFVKLPRFDGQTLSDDVFSDPIIETIAKEGHA